MPTKSYIQMIPTICGRTFKVRDTPVCILLSSDDPRSPEPCQRIRFELVQLLTAYARYICLLGSIVQGMYLSLSICAPRSVPVLPRSCPVGREDICRGSPYRIVAYSMYINAHRSSSIAGWIGGRGEARTHQPKRAARIDGSQARQTRCLLRRPTDQSYS